MQSKPKHQILSYKDAVQVFQDEDIVANLRDACQKLANASIALTKTFETISNQLRSLDKQMQGVASLESRWNACTKDFADIIRQQRVNAGFISGRLKMFCTVVLPLTARNLNNANTGSHQIHEKIHVLRSYMNISSDHCSLTHSLVQKSLHLSAGFVRFHTDYIESVSCQGGDRDEKNQLAELAQKLAELENIVEQIHTISSNLHLQKIDVNVTYFAICALRLSVFSSSKSCSSLRAEGEGERAKRPRLSPRNGGSGRISKISHHRLAFPSPELSTIGQLYEQLETTQNEILHIHYSTSLCDPSSLASSASAHTSPYTLRSTRSRSSQSSLSSNSKISTSSSNTNITSTLLTLSRSTLDVLIGFEALLSLFIAIWGRLDGDCQGIIRWLHQSEVDAESRAFLNDLLDSDVEEGQETIPDAIRTYLDAGTGAETGAETGSGSGTLYASIANALDVFVAVVDQEYVHGE